MAKCELCPRKCGIDREKTTGVCGEGADMRVAKIMLHRWEEPCISGVGAGSGAIFFSGCAMKCVYCQNREISRGGAFGVTTEEALADEILKLQSKGAANINFVTPTHFTDRIIKALDLVMGQLKIPVVWNTSGYELPETVRALDGKADIFLTDFKYVSSELSKKYSNASDYAKIAETALSEMVKIAGRPVFDGEGMMKRGVIVRHLVLPGCYKDSVEVLKLVAGTVGAENVILSLMSQYTPEFLDDGHPELARRITAFEYKKVLDAATELGFDGYMQSRSSASSRYTPNFKDK